MEKAIILFAMLTVALGLVAQDGPSIGPVRGSLVIHGGGTLTNETIERFVALAGGPNANFVVIPTALSDEKIEERQLPQSFLKFFRVRHATILHTRDRARANSESFVEPLRHATGVWIDGGRQWRLADVYLGTAVEREIKALLARGGVVCGSSAGATIQGSFLVRGAPATPENLDGDNRIMMSPGHEAGFGLLANSAIDQHVDARGREGDLDSVIAAHPSLLGIGLAQDAAIVVHGNSFFVVGGRVAIHDGKEHDGSPYYFLSSGQAFNLATRFVDPTYYRNSDSYPYILLVSAASRNGVQKPIKTVGAGVLEPEEGSGLEPQHLNFECAVSLYSLGNNRYPVRLTGAHQFKVLTREIDGHIPREFTCNY